MSFRILCIETATRRGSVSLFEGNQLLGEQIIDDDSSHAEQLAPAIQHLIEKGEPSFIAVSKGPGSYTGLRIGISLAKGLAFGWNCKLIAIDTLSATAHYLKSQFPDEDYYRPLLDARRMEVYTALFDKGGKRLEESHPQIVDADTYKIDADKKLVFGGNAVEKIEERYPSIDYPNFRFEKILPDSKFLHPLAVDAIEKSDFADIADLEPQYLKEYKAGNPSAKIKRLLFGD